jgi:uncharacterized protein YjeT (DUF2065 family)
MEGHTGTVLMAVALAFIFEGLLPFLMPLAWRNTFRRITEMSEGQIRFLGLTLMIIGLLLLFLTN